MPLDCCAGTFECIMVGLSLLMKVGFLDDTMLGCFDALETGELLVATLGRPLPSILGPLENATFGVLDCCSMGELDRTTLGN